MDSSNSGVFYSDLMGEFDINIADTVTFTDILVDSISENTPGNTVVFGSDITTKNVVPDQNNLRNLGAPSKRFQNAYITNLNIIGLGAIPNITLTDTSNQITMGSGNTVKISAPTPAANRIHTIPDVASANFVMTQGDQQINGVKQFNSTPWIPASVTQKFQFNGTGDGTFATFLTCPAPTGLREVRIPDSGSTLTNDIITSRGTQSIISPKTFNSAVTISSTSGQLIMGSGNTITINATAPASSRTYLVPDVSTDTSFAMLGGTQTFTGAKLFTNSVTSNVYIANPSSAPSFGSDGGLYLDVSGNMNFRVPGVGSTGTYNYANGSGIPFVYMNPVEGVATGAVNFSFQKSLPSVSTSCIYNSLGAGAGIELYGKNSLKMQLFNGIGTTDYITIDPTNFIQCTQRTKVTDTTASTSSSTGALVVTGGVGIGGDLYVGGTITTSSGLILPNSYSSLPQQTLTDYGINSNRTVNVTGPCASTAVNFCFSILGNKVTITVSQFVATGNNTTAVMTITGGIPAIFRPTATRKMPLVAASYLGTNNQTCMVEIQAGGNILIYPAGTTGFSPLVSPNQFTIFSFSYTYDILTTY